MPSRATRAAGPRRGTCAFCTGGAITGITSGWDTERQRLEPDAEQSARPVLRGALDSDVVAPTRRRQDALSSNSVVGQRMAVSLGVELSNRFVDGAVEVIRTV